ncbi:MAG: PQQ-binding-like beta-propeller repeat protein [Rhodospirillaceae bacterium]|nr:PQQ-binding-like beta-propeller repeat protein [Rhodospirillaceae bacterium]
MLIARNPDRLDWGPVPAGLPAVGAPWVVAWRTDIPGAGAAARLRSHGCRLFLTVPTVGVAEITVDAPPPCPSPLASEPLLQLYPGLGGTAVAVDGGGGIRRWQPDGVTGPRLDMQCSGTALDPIGLDDGRVAVLRAPAATRPDAAAGDDGWSLAVVDPTAGRRLWQRSGRLRSLLPGPGVVFAVEADGRAVLCLEAASGNIVWRHTTSHPIDDLFASCHGHVWCRGSDGGLVGIAAGDGQASAWAALASASQPVGIVDGLGRLVVCTGIAIAVVDLRTGRVEQQAAFAPGVHGPMRAHGWRCLPAGDGHVVFADMNGRVHLAAIAAGARPAPIWDAPDRITGMTALGGTLVVLTAGGCLFALRPA